jgi:hypothetical protein
MANTVAAQGFQPFGYASGWSPSFGLTARKILFSYATKIHRGTPVIGISTGYINVATATTIQMAGIFWGCEYFSAAAKRPVFSNYWPAGSPSGTLDAKAFIIDDPNVLFKVQSDGTAAWALADIGNNVQLVTGTGNDATGMSGYLGNHTTANTNTFPFRLMDLYSSYVPAGTDGADDTSVNNCGIVRLNFTDRVSALGI